MWGDDNSVEWNKWKQDWFPFVIFFKQCTRDETYKNALKVENVSEWKCYL